MATSDQYKTSSVQVSGSAGVFGWSPCLMNSNSCLKVNLLKLTRAINSMASVQTCSDTQAAVTLVFYNGMGKSARSTHTDSIEMIQHNIQCKANNFTQ